MNITDAPVKQVINLPHSDMERRPACISREDSNSLFIADVYQHIEASRQSKEKISLRIDKDILDYLKNQGPGYQGRINSILRAFVDMERKILATQCEL